MQPIGKLSYRYFEGPGVRFGFEIGAYESHYTIRVTLNGAPTATARRRSLSLAVECGLRTAAAQLALLGLQPVQLPLGQILDEIC